MFPTRTAGSHIPSALQIIGEVQSVESMHSGIIPLLVDDAAVVVAAVVDALVDAAVVDALELSALDDASDVLPLVAIIPPIPPMPPPPVVVDTLPLETLVVVDEVVVMPVDVDALPLELVDVVSVLEGTVVHAAPAASTKKNVKVVAEERVFMAPQSQHAIC